MNIARIGGIKDVRSALVASLGETEAQTVSFAESLGNSMSDTTQVVSEKELSQKGAPAWRLLVMPSQGERELSAMEVVKSVAAGEQQKTSSLSVKEAASSVKKDLRGTGVIAGTTKDVASGASAAAKRTEEKIVGTTQGKTDAKSLLLRTTKINAQGDAAGAQEQGAISPLRNKEEKEVSVAGVAGEGAKEDSEVVAAEDIAPEGKDAKTSAPVAKPGQALTHSVNKSREKEGVQKIETASESGKAENRKVAKKEGDSSTVQASVVATQEDGKIASLQQQGGTAVSISQPVAGESAANSTVEAGREKAPSPVSSIGEAPRRGKGAVTRSASNAGQQAIKPEEREADARDSEDVVHEEVSRRTEPSGEVQAMQGSAPSAHSSEPSHSAMPSASNAHAAVTAFSSTGDHTLSQSGTVVAATHAMKTQSDAGVGFAQPYETAEQRTMVATPTTLEVGVPGGTHGWLKVRAEMAGDGGVHASVSASSDSGAEMLRRELPTLTSFLHQEQVAVSSVVVHASPVPGGSTDLMGGGGGTHRDMGQQGMADAQGGSRHEDAAMRRAVTGAGMGAAEEDGVEDWPLATGYAGAGGWLSVRA